MDSETKKKAIKDATQNGVFQANKYASNLETTKQQQENQKAAALAALAKQEQENKAAMKKAAALEALARLELANKVAMQKAAEAARQKAQEDFRNEERKSYTVAPVPAKPSLWSQITSTVKKIVAPIGNTIKKVSALAAKPIPTKDAPPPNWFQKIIDKWTAPSTPSGHLYGKPGWVDLLPPLIQMPLEILYSKSQSTTTMLLSDSKVVNFIKNAYSYETGAATQFVNDYTMGLYGWATGWQPENGNSFYQDGRETGRVFSTVAGQIEAAVGGALFVSGISFIPPTMGGTAACAAGTGPVAILCLGVGGGAIAIESAAVAGGFVVGGHGAGMLWNNANNPLQIRGNGGSNLPPNPEKGFFGTNAQDTGKNSARLYENMGSPKRLDGYQAHHIVPAGSKREAAVEAWQILEEFGIDINNAGNGVMIPGKVNGKLNNPDYEKAILRALQSAKNNGSAKEDILYLLQDIGNQILAIVLQKSFFHQAKFRKGEGVS